jgi:mono/diheme cytochrome c family protein
MRRRFGGENREARALIGFGTFALAAAALGCNQSPFPDIDLERMIDQRKYRPYQASEFFKDGRAMRSPPEGTIAADRPGGDPAVVDGVSGGLYVAEIPVAVNRDFVERGRANFEVFCAPCHGMAGDGDSMVARNMQLRPPPSLVDAGVRAMPAGRIFQIVTLGYGLMPSYAHNLSIDDRWATVAYVRALQLRNAVALDKLPLAVRARAEEKLR